MPRTSWHSAAAFGIPSNDSDYTSDADPAQGKFNFGDDGANVFDFTVSRHRDGPQEFLKDYAGILLGDCYSGFESIELASDQRLTRAACNAHARRKVYESREHHPLEAAQLLALYRRLYDIEDQCRGKSPEEVLALRRSSSVPIMKSKGRHSTI